MVRVVVILMLVLLPSLARAAEDKAEKRRAEAAVTVFQRAYAHKDPGKRMDAVAGLRDFGHPLVVEEIGKSALVDKVPDVRRVAAQVLGYMKDQAADAGPLLAKHLEKNAKVPEVQIAIVRSIRRLDYRDARAALIKAAGNYREETHRHVTDEVLITFGKFKDAHALPLLLTLYEVEGVHLRGKSGPRVRAANREQARRIYEKKYGKLRDPKGTPETIVRWWQQEMENAITQITGEQSDDAPAFRTWLKKNYKTLGLKRSELPKKPKKKSKVSVGEGKGK